MGLYEQLSEVDILQPLLPGFQQRKLKLFSDGKIHWEASLDPNWPWLSGRICPQRLCSKWHEIYFAYCRIIPRGCRNCWKVTFKPETLVELMKVYQLQQETDIPGKCGVETRAWTGNLGGYSSFWYAPLDGGLKQARELHELLRTKLTTLLQTDVKNFVSLKRGCTEMEHHSVRVGLGGSDKWDEGAKHFDMIEDLLNATFVDPDVEKMEEPTIFKIHVRKAWIEWAAEHGDMTYLQFTDGKFNPEIVGYHGSVHSERDFRTTWKEEGGNGNGKPESNLNSDTKIALV
jgi:hypothetical protein